MHPLNILNPLIQENFLCKETVRITTKVETWIFCLGSRVVGLEMAKELVLAFLGARFSAAERHVRRLDKVRQLEENNAADV